MERGVSLVTRKANPSLEGGVTMELLLVIWRGMCAGCDALGSAPSSERQAGPLNTVTLLS